MRQKSILIVLLLIATVYSVQAQFRVAAIGGGNVSAIPMTLNGVELEIYDPRPGFHGGLMGIVLETGVEINRQATVLLRQSM